ARAGGPRTAGGGAVRGGGGRPLHRGATRPPPAPAGEHALSLTALEDDGVGLVDDCPPLAARQLDLRRGGARRHRNDDVVAAPVRTGVPGRRKWLVQAA